VLIAGIGLFIWQSIISTPLPPSQREFYLAHFANETLKCESITDQALRTSCEDGVRTAQASTMLNDSTCVTISDPAKRNDCLDQATLKIALRDNNPAVCDRNPDPAGCRDRYYRVWTEHSKTPSACGSIANETSRQLCYDQFTMQDAFRKGNCDAIQNQQMREECTDIYHPGVRP
jgi:hypothetical protein